MSVAYQSPDVKGIRDLLAPDRGLADKDRATLVRCEQYKHFLSICKSAPSEWLAANRAQARPRSGSKPRVIRDNLAVLDQFFADYKDSRLARTDGGCVASAVQGVEGVEDYAAAGEESACLFLHRDFIDGARPCRRIAWGRVRALAVPKGAHGAAEIGSSSISGKPRFRSSDSRVSRERFGEFGTASWQTN